MGNEQNTELAAAKDAKRPVERLVMCRDCLFWDIRSDSLVRNKNGLVMVWAACTNKTATDDHQGIITAVNSNSGTFGCKHGELMHRNEKDKLYHQENILGT